MVYCFHYGITELLDGWGENVLPLLISLSFWPLCLFGSSESADDGSKDQSHIRIRGVTVYQFPASFEEQGTSCGVVSYSESKLTASALVREEVMWATFGWVPGIKTLLGRRTTDKHSW